MLVERVIRRLSLLLCEWMSPCLMLCRGVVGRRWRYLCLRHAHCKRPRL